MSARAAWRLESLQFGQVYRYTPGKMDWLANGLPCEGEEADIYQAAGLVRREVPTCRLEERIGEVRERTGQSGWDVCVVVNEQQIVMGLLRGKALQAGPDSTVEQVMELAPRTYRLNASLSRIKDYMEKTGEQSVLITSSDGELVGILQKGDLG